MVRGGVILAIATATACGKSKAQVDAAPGDGDVDAASLVDGAVSCTLPSALLRASTLSGCEVAGTVDGPRGVALFANPVNLVLGGSGVAYVADFDSNRLRKVDVNGRVTTLVHQPGFARPFGLALASDGFLYVETDDDDQNRHSLTTGTIWRVNPATGAAAVLARDIGRPRGLAALPDGRIATADYEHHVVAIFDPATGLLTPLAGMMDAPGHVNGKGAAAQFSSPWDIALLPGGDLAVSDFDTDVIRRVTPAGVVTDLAGTPGVAGHDDGLVANATFDGPKGLAVDAAGVLYITEAGNHDIRRIAAGGVGTIAGSRVAGWLDSDSPLQAQFFGVEGLDVSPNGTRIVIADGNVGTGVPFNHVRVVVP